MPQVPIHQEALPSIYQEAIIKVQPYSLLVAQAQLQAYSDTVAQAQRALPPSLVWLLTSWCVPYSTFQPATTFAVRSSTPLVNLAIVTWGWCSATQHLLWSIRWRLPRHPFYLVEPRLSMSALHGLPVQSALDSAIRPPSSFAACLVTAV